MRLLSIAIFASMFAVTAWAGQEAPATGKSNGLGRDVVLILLGALIGFVAAYLQDRRRRAADAKDVAGALYQEIADRAARSCLDFRKSWQGHLTDPNDENNMRFDLKRLLKFRPAEPVVYPGIGIKMALLKPGIASPVIHFYFRLDAWRRDIDHWRDRSEEFKVSQYLSPEDCKLLAKRLGETLSPAIQALAALQGAVPAHTAFDHKAMDAYNIKGDDLKTALREMADIADTAGKYS